MEFLWVSLCDLRPCPHTCFRVTENRAFTKLLTPDWGFSETLFQCWYVKRENWVFVLQCQSVHRHLLWCLFGIWLYRVSCYLHEDIFCNGGSHQNVVHPEEWWESFLWHAVESTCLFMWKDIFFKTGFFFFLNEGRKKKHFKKYPCACGIGLNLGSHYRSVGPI